MTYTDSLFGMSVLGHPNPRAHCPADFGARSSNRARERHSIYKMHMNAPKSKVPQVVQSSKLFCKSLLEGFLEDDLSPSQTVIWFTFGSLPCLLEGCTYLTCCSCPPTSPGESLPLELADARVDSPHMPIGALSQAYEGTHPFQNMSRLQSHPEHRFYRRFSKTLKSYVNTFPGKPMYM